MSVTHRQKVILDWVQEQKQVAVEDIAEHFGVTTQTIRRDLNKLCEQGLLRRHYGGVSLPPRPHNVSIHVRQSRYVARKEVLAQAVAQFIPNHVTISVGVGSTVAQVARALVQHQGLKVLTNNLNVAAALSVNPDIEVIVSGGQYRHADNDVVGPEVTDFYSSFMTDFGIFSAGSLDVDSGVMDFDVREAEATRAIIANTRQRVLVADHSKWSQNASCKVATFNYVDRFYTEAIMPEQRAAIAKTVSLQLCPLPFPGREDSEEHEMSELVLSKQRSA